MDKRRPGAKTKPAGQNSVGRPPGPSGRVRAAVLEAVVDELVERGYSGLTIERVASRAGVARATVYNHWPNREALVYAAAAESYLHGLPVTCSGDWRSDLRALCRALAVHFSQPGPKALLRTITAAAASDPKLNANLIRFFETQSAVLQRPVDEARARGDLSVAVNSADVVSLLAGALFLELVFADRPLSEDTIDRLTGLVFAATTGDGGTTDR